MRHFTEVAEMETQNHIFTMEVPEEYISHW